LIESYSDPGANSPDEPDEQDGGKKGMALKRWILLVLLISLPLLGVSPRESAAQAGPGAQAPRPAAVAPAPMVKLPQTQRPLDLVVTVTMSNGTAETFSREIDTMEIVTLPSGRVDAIHLILVSGGERNTHVWYNYSNVAKLSYRFVTREGRNKVKVRIVQSSKPSRELTDRLDPLGPRDYR
jgi:hypothetical protein